MTSHITECQCKRGRWWRIPTANWLFIYLRLQQLATEVFSHQSQVSGQKCVHRLCTSQSILRIYQLHIDLEIWAPPFMQQWVNTGKSHTQWPMFLSACTLLHHITFFVLRLGQPWGPSTYFSHIQAPTLTSFFRVWRQSMQGSNPIHQLEYNTHPYIATVCFMH